MAPGSRKILSSRSVLKDGQANWTGMEKELGMNKTIVAVAVVVAFAAVTMGAVVFGDGGGPGRTAAVATGTGLEWKRVSNSLSVLPGKEGLLQVPCPDTWYLAGGGFYSASLDVDVYGSYPTHNAQWAVGVKNNNLFNTRTLTIFANCIR
jgi:hypothetical protein